MRRVLREKKSSGRSKDAPSERATSPHFEVTNFQHVAHAGPGDAAPFDMAHMTEIPLTPIEATAPAVHEQPAPPPKAKKSGRPDVPYDVGYQWTDVGLAV